MKDPRVEKLAQTLVYYSMRVQKGDRVAINGSVEAAPLMRAVGREVLRAGGHPIQLPQLQGWAYEYLSLANDEQLEFVNPIAEMVLGEFECSVHIRSDLNTRELNNIPPERRSRQAKASAPMLKRYRERSAAGDYRWVITVFPTRALAQDAQMSLQEFEDFVFSATFSDRDDPIAAWRQIHDEQQRLVDYLAGKSQVEVKGPNVDLTLSIEGRSFRNSDGDRNMPSGEVFTSPVEDSAQGFYRGSYPALHRGQEVQGVELRFEDGLVVEASAERNEAFLLEMLDMDEGARRLGEFAIATNYGIDRFSRMILFDEKMGGTMHIALGSGFADLGGKNESVLHWDIITDLKEDTEIRVDGELFYANGEFKL